MVHAGIAFKVITVDAAEIAAQDDLDVTATVAGLRSGHPCIVWAPSLEAQLVLSNAHCSAANTLKFRLTNIDAAAAVNAASQSMYVVQF